MKSEIRRRRRAYTLVEMLIVVTIMIMLVAVSLPVAKKTMEGSHGREASRQLHAYFAMAKARALQTGRPCGLYFSFPNPPLGGPSNPDPSSWNALQFASYWPVRQVTQVMLAEVPPHYSGSTTTAVGKMDTSGGTPVLRIWNGAVGPADPTEAQFLDSLLFVGEQFLVRFNYKGDWYICNYAGNYVFTYVRPLQGTVFPYGYGNPSAPGVPFQILRSPRPIGNAMDLPRGTCIDITYSGVGHASRQFPSSPTSIAKNLAVMLAPNGGIDSMYVNGFPTADPVGALYFLIGKVEKVPTSIGTSFPNPPTDYANIEFSNLADPNSLWVVVNRSTAQVTTAENMPSPSVAVQNPGNLGLYVQAARQAAILGEQMGGQ